MGEYITVDKSVGTNGVNTPGDVAKIGNALVQLGPERGGIYAVPLSTGGLAEAIRMFQNFHTLPARNGKVDPGPADVTLRKLNEILNPGVKPPMPAPAKARSGGIKHLTSTGMPDSVRKTPLAPHPHSLKSDFIPSWDGFFGSGKIHYFELDEDVVPNWFGVLVPDGLTSFQHVHLFFHPTPNQGTGHKDPDYASKKDWAPLFYYLSGEMAALFCAAKSNQVLIMPLMTFASQSTCGILPERWEAIFGQLVGRIQAGTPAQQVAPLPILSMVVSSFSNGIIYNHMFRARAKLGGRLRGVVDFDGAFSTNRQYAVAAPFPAVKLWQTPVTPHTLPGLAAQNIFPVPVDRWGFPWKRERFPKDPRAAAGALHGMIPKTMMHFAATMTRAP